MPFVLFCTCLVCFPGCRRSSDPPPEILQEAIRSGDTAQLETWLEDNPKLVEKPMDSGATPLHVAAEANQVKCIELFLARGAKPDATDSRNRTPLQYAAAWGQTESAAFLLDRGARLMHRDRDGLQAIHLAVQNAQDQVLSLLIARGADVNARLGEGTTPLHSAVFLHFDEVARVLVEAGADPVAKKNDGITPLELAKAKGRTNIVELLESHAAK